MAEYAVAEDGCRLWVGEVGWGDPVILCHGGPGLWDMFGEVAGMLAPGMRVIRWDQRGCGRSDRRGPYSAERAVADVEVVRRHFGLDRVTVLGHSWGAELALRYAVAHPGRVRALVYVSGTGLGTGWREEFERNFEARLGARLARWRELRERDRSAAEERELAVLQWSAEFADADTAVACAERMAKPWFEINYECNAAMGGEPQDVRACRGLRVPTLVVDGARDLRPRWAVNSLCAALPSVRRVVLGACGHVPWLEEPEKFRSVLVGFLRGVAAGPHPG